MGNPAESVCLSRYIAAVGAAALRAAATAAAAAQGLGCDCVKGSEYMS